MMRRLHEEADRLLPQVGDPATIGDDVADTSERRMADFNTQKLAGTEWAFVTAGQFPCAAGHGVWQGLRSAAWATSIRRIGRL